MTSPVENITESLRRTRQSMVQANTFITGTPLQTLQDSEKRVQYDEGRTRGSVNEDSTTGDAEGFRYAYRSHFSDSFHKIFSRSLKMRLKVELVLSFSEAAKGCTKDLSFDAHVPCDSCYGRGHPLDAKTRICPTCGGFGKFAVLLEYCLLGFCLHSQHSFLIYEYVEKGSLATILVRDIEAKELGGWKKCQFTVPLFWGASC